MISGTVCAAHVAGATIVVDVDVEAKLNRNKDTMDTATSWLTGLLSRTESQVVAIDAAANNFCYADLWPQVAQLVRQQRQGVVAGRWLVSCDDSVHFLIALLAVAIDGGHLVLPVNATQGGVNELLTDIDGVITDQGLRGERTLQLPVTPDMSYAESVEWLQRLLTTRPATAVSVRLFTSGSTGKPKAIDKPLRLLLREVVELERQWGASQANTVVASTVSAQHLYGLLFRLLCPLSGGRIFLRHTLLYPEQLRSIPSIEGRRIVLVSTPALLSRLQGLSTEVDFDSVFSSGGPLSMAASDQVVTALRQRPIEIFGSSETGAIAWRQSVVDNTPWRCLDALTVGAAADGRLLLTSPFLEDDDNPLLLDDLVEPIDEQHFHHRGRSDSVIKIAEKRVSLFDINHRLMALEQVEQAYSLFLSGGDRDEVVAVLVLSRQGCDQLAVAGKNKLLRTLRAALREGLEPVAIPRRFRYLTALPYNSQGKLSKQLLVDLFQHD